jgi:hypothetical protein
MSRLTRVLPWISFALVIASWAPGVYYDRFSYEVTLPSDLVWAASFLAFPLVGLFLTLRFRSNAVGWLFLIGPALAGLGVSASEYGEAIDSASIQEVSDVPLLIGFMCLVASIILFPDGHYPSRWFRWAHILLLSGLAVAGLTLSVESPVTAGFMFINLILPVPALTFRAVRGDATSRRQIAGPVLVSFVGILTLVVVYALISEDIDPGNWSAVIAFMLLTVGIPVSIAVAITRYRLYDIDRIISRTVSYALVAGVLALLVAGVSAVAGSRFKTPWVVAATTLAVAALFNPVRKRMQERVDRRFNRSSHDTEQVMDEFAGSLRDEVNADELIDGWVDVVEETMQPSSLGVWVRP